jgi:hypothetical protein
MIRYFSLSYLSCIVMFEKEKHDYMRVYVYVKHKTEPVLFSLTESFLLYLNDSMSCDDSIILRIRDASFVTYTYLLLFFLVYLVCRKVSSICA